MRINPIDPVYRHSHKKREDDKSYLAWLRLQPSALSGLGPCIAAHYRTSKNSGIGIKPLYSAIPLTYTEHQYQHQIGQYQFMPKTWWEEKVSKYVKEWNQESKRREVGNKVDFTV